MDASALLAAYDEQLRGDREIPSALPVTRLGPLRLAVFPGGRGFTTYRDLQGADAEQVERWVGESLEHFRALDEVSEAEWKTRGHDRAPGLHEALVSHGFEPEEPESIMIGEARLLAVDVPLPEGVSLRRVTEAADVRLASELQTRVFDGGAAPERTEEMVRRVARDDGMQLWAAFADGVVVCVGRVDPVAGTDFAGLWGGVTLESWRGRGIYRALTAARARVALDSGKTLMNSDSTEFSRPILERSGLVKVSTTTPYVWHR